jgi:hypothetical protein
MNNIDINTILMVALAGVVTALLTGKTFRRLLLLPFEWISSKTGSKVDDKLVEEARKDLGIPDATHTEEDKK